MMFDNGCREQEHTQANCKTNEENMKLKTYIK